MSAWRPAQPLTVPALPKSAHKLLKARTRPATAGTHIHFLSPVDLERTAWHIGYQDVAAVGHLFAPASWTCSV
jgi:Na+-transporting NADH:ubiquinone oxidoreductase subunit NqrA